MSDTLLKLKNKLPETLTTVLQSVNEQSVALDIPVMLVGATARDVILHNIYDLPISRATEDVDFGIAVDSWAEYELLKKSLLSESKFGADSKIEHRLWRSDNASQIKIDIFGL